MTTRSPSANPADLVKTIATGLYVDGQWRPASGNALFDVLNPATGEVLTQVSDASSDDGLAALDAADRARDSWAQTAPRVRSEMLHSIFEAIIDRTEELATTMTLEMGKSLAEARGEVTYAAEFFRWFAEEAVRIDGGYRTAPDGKNRLLVTRRPVGPCLLITPWNFPLAMGARKIAPALAAGCTCVVKPAELTPLTSQLLMEIIDDVGVPAGVVNMVPTTNPAGISEPLMVDQRLRKISFTGSTPVGKRLLAQASENVLRTSMELGGNAPFIVFDDADLDAAIDGAMAAKYRNIGEACTAANRFFVHENIAEDFIEQLTARSADLTSGSGLEPDNDLGPLVDDKSRSKVHSLVQDAVHHGAEVHTGGQMPVGPGYFYPATVLSNAGVESEIHREEIFGPVVSVVTFSDEDEAVRRANDTEFGLVAYLYTGDMSRGLRMIERLQYGMVGLNAGVISTAAAPFGGVKHSGMGREGGDVGIEEFLDTVYAGIGDPSA